MAQDRYTNETLEAGSKVLPGAGLAGQLFVLNGTDEKEAADTDGSVLRLGQVPANAIPIPHLSVIGNDALAGATDVEIGLYKQKGGAAVDIDILLGTADINAGNAAGSELNAMSAIGLADYGKDLRTLVSDADNTEFYDVAITGNTFGVAEGTISWTLVFLLPQA